MKMDRDETLVKPRGLRGALLFALPALIGVLLVATVIAWKQELFASRTPIYAFSDSALGMTRGMPVKVFGITVGSVSGVEIVPGAPGARGRVRVRMDINSEFLQHITRDSRARLMRETLVGQSVIEIVPGALQSRPVARNEVIAFERGKTLGELSEELNKALEPVLAQVKDAMADLRNPDGQVHKSMQQVSVLLQELPETNRRLQSVMDGATRTLGKAEHLLGTADRAMAGTAARAESALGEIEKTAGTVGAAAPGILLKIDAAAESLARTSDSARRLTEDAARRMPPLLDDGASVVRNVGEVVEGARGAWPLRNFVEQPGVKTLPIDTHETSGPR
ncbi:MAG TPA: MlaD family protein [Burkholderiales bacterium]|nr:MlaD family protein [Burkholderiales bacterium]